jgi:hypothetical protein
MSVKDMRHVAVEERKWSETRVAMVMMDGWRCCCDANAIGKRRMLK